MSSPKDLQNYNSQTGNWLLCLFDIFRPLWPRLFKQHNQKYFLWQCRYPHDIFLGNLKPFSLSRHKTYLPLIVPCGFSVARIQASQLPQQTIAKNHFLFTFLSVLKVDITSTFELCKDGILSIAFITDPTEGLTLPVFRKVLQAIDQLLCLQNLQGKSSKVSKSEESQ